MLMTQNLTNEGSFQEAKNRVKKAWVAKHIPKVIVGEVDDEIVNVTDFKLIYKREGLRESLKRQNLEWRPEAYV